MQGEGFHAGRPAVFCRFTGCNLWTGLEKDRHKAVCQFCDTDFVGTDGENGGKYSAQELTDLIVSLFPSRGNRFVVFTGGEPALQLDEGLIYLLHQEDFTIAVETNGTRELPVGIDWICVSPKAGSDIIIKEGHELKLVHPQIDQHPRDFEDWDFDNFYLQPLDDDNQFLHTQKCISYCLDHPQWKLSVQTHKWVGLK